MSNQNMHLFKEEILGKLPLNPYKPGILFMGHSQTEYSPRYDTAKHGVPSGAILFADMNFIEKLNKNEKFRPDPLKMKVDLSIW